MCGLAGFVGPLGASLEPVRRWGERLAHRGPDDLGIGVLEPEGLKLGRDLSAIGPRARAVLWHRRLSIIDLGEGGWQPMRAAGRDLALVYNGEIYNYVELRAELEAQGVTFRSHSDTEVLLEAFARWGTGALPRLVGMFALALLDVDRRTLLLARDPFGIKPLVFSQWSGGFAFASEPKALLDLPTVSRRVNPRALYDYLRFGLTDHRAGTLLEGVRSLPPAHWMEVSIDDARASAPVRYFRLDPERRFEGSFERAADLLRERFLESVRLHLRSDVRVGTALSGGVDSSAIVAAMRAVEPAAEIHAFGYVAEDPALNESRWIETAAGAAGATVHPVRLGPADLAADLDTLLDAQDEPFGGTSIHAQFRVFRLARDAGIKVMLDGQGADELLGGYHGLVAARLASLVRQGRWAEAARFASRASRAPGRSALPLWAGEFLAPPSLQAPLRRMVGQELAPAWLNGEWFAARGVSPAPAKYAGAASREVLREQMCRLLTRTNLPMLLRYEDRNSMAHSIESRVPFLTPALAELALSLPEEFLIDRDGVTKAVFRRAMRGLVPDTILERRDKIGFATPEHEWMPALRPQVERALASDVAARIPALRIDALRAEWARVLDRRPRRDFRAWRWFNLIEWVRRTGATFA